MYELNDILKKYGKNLKYIEIKTLYFSKDSENIHLASLVQFTEESFGNQTEAKNNMNYLASYIEATPDNIRELTSNLNKGFIINSEMKLSVNHSFKEDQIKLNFYPNRNYINGYFQFELHGWGVDNIDHDKLYRGIHSFGTDTFESLSKEKLGIPINTADGSMYLRIPVNLSVYLIVANPKELVLTTFSNLIEEQLIYSIKFFNTPKMAVGNNIEEKIIKDTFQQIIPQTQNTISIETHYLIDYDSVLLNIFDVELGITLSSYYFTTRKLLAKSNVFTSVLQEAYSLFRNPEEFKKSILSASQDISKSRPQSRFELEVSRILNCGGLQAIWLENNDAVKEGPTTSIVADILAYDDRANELYVISCKTGTSNSDDAVNKVVGARNKIKSLLKRPEIAVRACIITLQQVDETPFMRSEKVILINKSKLEELIQHKSKFILK